MWSYVVCYDDNRQRHLLLDASVPMQRSRCEHGAVALSGSTNKSPSSAATRSVQTVQASVQESLLSLLPPPRAARVAVAAVQIVVNRAACAVMSGATDVLNRCTMFVCSSATGSSSLPVEIHGLPSIGQSPPARCGPRVQTTGQPRAAASSRSVIPSSVPKSDGIIRTTKLTAAGNAGLASNSTSKVMGGPPNPVSTAGDSDHGNSERVINPASLLSIRSSPYERA